RPRRFERSRTRSRRERRSGRPPRSRRGTPARWPRRAPRARPPRGRRFSALVPQLEPVLRHVGGEHSEREGGGGQGVRRSEDEGRGGSSAQAKVGEGARDLAAFEKPDGDQVEEV